MSATKASATTRELKKLYKDNNLPEDGIVVALQKAANIMRLAGASLVKKENVRFSGKLEDGKPVTSLAEVVFGRFGGGEKAIFLAFTVYDGGHVDVYRVFSKRTATMRWLEDYVSKELAG